MSAIPLQIPPLEVLNNTIGALEAGGMVACLLMGVVTTQAYYYYSKFPNDHIRLKLMVAFIWFCELGHSICISHAIYIITVISWSDPRILLLPPKTLPTAIFFSALSTQLVQNFLAYRIKGVGGSWTLTTISWLLSLVRSVMAIISFAAGVNMVSLDDYLKQWKWSIMATIIIGVMNDLLIALSLIWVLLQQRNTTVSKSTTAIIDTLIRWTLQTGLLTSLGGILMMILFLAMPHNFIWLCVFTFLAKLYSNSLMAALNGRDSLRERSGIVVELYPTTGYPGNSTLSERTRSSNRQYVESETRHTGMEGKASASDSQGDVGRTTANIVISQEVNIS
ncbi:hypothetical protein E1B28_010829 [Marasmius oreades]|uniref:DUF6534 domain-containing protein n=1 Tax=Marasmius oreades TaxID=181124 RepID=A0A9P7RTV8_9AGAR|nr:uncharacterized protein E1B28_010829 [Marasmius oreades]KAG7089121.1 hypothetical protein E1B28_010829 [Marasmius oreades]